MVDYDELGEWRDKKEGLHQLELRRAALAQARCDLVASQIANGRSIESISDADLLLSTQRILHQLTGWNTFKMSVDALLRATATYFKNTSEGAELTSKQLMSKRRS